MALGADPLVGNTHAAHLHGSSEALDLRATRSEEATYDAVLVPPRAGCRQRRGEEVVHPALQGHERGEEGEDRAGVEVRCLPRDEGEGGGH
jgi:hypothetical protein